MRKNSGQQHIKHPNPFAPTQNKPPTAGFVELVDEKMKKPKNKHTAWKATRMAAKLAKDPEKTQAKITEKALQAFALAQYLERHMRLQSAMLTIFAFLLVGLGNLVADLRVGIAATAYGACLALMEQEHTVCEAHLVNSSHLPHDFLQKGTISNVAQDISSVEGRIWAVALLFASVGLLVSGYTFQLYRPWLYSDTDEERRAEAVVRAVWATFPQVGFMLTAAIPAMSGATGLQWAFGAIHNTMAPLAMLAIVTFETVQLSFGERAFTRFFGSAEEAHRIETELSHRGERPRNSAQFCAILRNSLSLLFTSTGERLTPLVLTQKLRVLTLLVAWACGLTFVSLQVMGRHCHRHRHLHHHRLHLTSSTIPTCRATSPSASTTRTSSPSSRTARRWAAPSSPSSSPHSPASTTCAARARRMTSPAASSARS